jgi:hypothetical protein
MTDKEFVLRVYPEAMAKKDFFTHDWGIWNNGSLLSKYAPELTEDIAWENAKKRINKEMMRKLES